MGTVMYTNVIDAFSFLTLGITFLIICTRKLNDIVMLLAVQAILLAGLTTVVAFASGITHIYFAAVATLLVKGVLVPAVLLYILKKIEVVPKVESFIGIRAGIMIGLVLVMISFYVAGPDLISGSPFTHNGVPISVSLVLLGLFIMISRKKALMQVVGLITMENGLFLLPVSTTYGMPLMVELGIFFDLLVGVIIMGVLAFRINQTFDTINTDKLNKLKG